MKSRFELRPGGRFGKRARARRCLAALAAGAVALVGSIPTQAQTPSRRKTTDRGARPPGPAEGQPTPSAFRRDTAATFRVESTLDERDYARTKQADEKRDEAIDELKKLIPRAPASKKDEMIFRLAELYWEKSKFKYFVEMQAFERAYQDWSESGQTGEPPTSKDFVRESELIAQNALRLYEKVLVEYPRYERNDEVLFYLGHNEYEAGNKKKGINHYWTLIKQFPKSHLVAESYLQLGEHFFNDNNVLKAKKAYERALAAPTGGRIYNYALYKLAWCDYNIQEYADGIDKLKEVIARSENKSDRKSLQLKSEALGDLARFFSYVDETDTAFAYFRRKGGEELAIQYTTRLGALYNEQGKWPLEIKTYRLLINQYPMHDKALYLQASIVDAYSKMGRRSRVRQEVERLVDLYRPQTPWYRAQRDRGESGKAALEYAYDLTESKLRDLVTDYHRDAQKRRDVPTYELARDIYAKYLEAFSDTESAYAMRFFYAEVLWALKEWKNAATQYRKVATTNVGERKAQGKYARTAAYNQILAWEKIIESGQEKGRLDRSKKIFERKRKGKANTRAVKRIRIRKMQKGRTYAEEAIPERELALSEACDLYFKIADPKDKDLPAIKFKAAFIYYRHNHFVAAAERYFEIIERWPRDGLSKKAANLVLDSLNVQEKWDELAFYAEKFRDNRRLTGRDPRFKQEVQTLLEGASYKALQRQERQARQLQEQPAREQELARVASRFAAFQKRFSDSEHADKAVYASVIIYNQADELDHAIAASELLKKSYPSSKLSKENDWLLAEFYERIADFETSAKHFDAYYETYRKDKRASDALYNAALYWQGLGQNKKAIKRFRAYIQEFRSKNDVPEVYWRTCELNESDRDFKAAAKCFDDYRRRFRSAEPAKVFESRYRYALLMEKLRKRPVAIKEYNWLVGQYPRLKSEDRSKPGAQLAAAHAAFELLEVEYDEYVKMRVTLDKRKLKAKLDKAELLACVDTGGRKCARRQGKYLTILNYGNGDYGICALTRMGQVYREVATSIRQAPLPRRLTEDQIEIYKAELDTVALGPEEKGIQAFERALDKAYELNIYNECTLTAQSHLKELNPNKFPDLQKRRFQGAEGFITAGAKGRGRTVPAEGAETRAAKAMRSDTRRAQTVRTAAANAR